MPKKRSTPPRPRDLNELAHRVGLIATHQIEDENPTVNEKASKRGEARAAKLTPEERRKIAKKAAKARWHGSS
jgi:hypothetical protein